MLLSMSDVTTGGELEKVTARVLLLRLPGPHLCIRTSPFLMFGATVREEQRWGTELGKG